MVWTCKKEGEVEWVTGRYAQRTRLSGVWQSDTKPDKFFRGREEARERFARYTGVGKPS